MLSSFFHFRSKKKLCYGLLLAGVLLILTFVSVFFGHNGNKSFRKFTGEMFRREISSSTINLHYTLRDPSAFGISNTPVTFGEFSTDIPKTRAEIHRTRASLHRFRHSALSPENRLTYKVLDYYLATAEMGAPFLLYQEPLSPVTGIHAQLPVLLSEYTLSDSKDVDTYLLLLKQLPSYFTSLLHFQQKKQENGLLMPDCQIDAVLKQCKSFLDMGEQNYLYDTFMKRLNAIRSIDDTRKTFYLRDHHIAMQDFVFPAYRQLIQGMEALKGKGKNEQGLCYLPDGKKYYEYLVRQTTGISTPVKELQKKAKDQVYKDLSAFDSELRVSKDLFPSVLETDNADLILNDLKSKIKTSFPPVQDTRAIVKYVPAAMEPYLSPAFYMIPPLDHLKENVIYINRSLTKEGIGLYTTLAHEGYPGHLYQTVYFSSQNPDPVRNMLDFGGYVEGWATYCEMMAYYLSPLPKKEATLCQKNSSAFLGLYALADMGIHYDGWSRMDTYTFFHDFGINDTAIVNEIYDLIIGMPANYLKYYLGYLEFLHLKEDIAAKAGKDFSNVEFHRSILETGPAPFEIVREEAMKDFSKH